MFKSLMHATCRDNSSRRTSHCRDPLQRHFRRKIPTAKDWSTNASQRLAPLQGTNLLQGLDKLQRLDSAAKVPSVVILGSAEEVGSAAKAASAATATDQVSRLPLFPFSGASAMTNLLWPQVYSAASPVCIDSAARPVETPDTDYAASARSTRSARSAAAVQVL